jgi:2-haloacid dehalogenase
VAQRIRAVAFDIGGVLLDWNPRHLYRKLIADPAEMEDFLGRICTQQWHLAHDRGADIERSCEELAGRYPQHADLIMAWAYRGEEMIAGQLDDAIAVLAEVKDAGLRCYALSNMEAQTYALRRSRYPFFSLLDGSVISGVEGVTKPDRRIFEILLERYEHQPGETVFIDDTAGNVAAAGELGIRALRYSGAGRLRRDLRDAGLEIGDVLGIADRPC